MNTRIPSRKVIWFLWVMGTIVVLWNASLWMISMSEASYGWAFVNALCVGCGAYTCWVGEDLRLKRKERLNARD